MIKNIITSAVVSLVLVVGVFLFVQKSPTPEAQRVGSLSGPDISSPYIAVNGLATYSATVVMVQGASTTCQYQTPAATTTLSAFAYRFGLASSSAAQIEMGKSSGPNATTTLFGTTFNIAAGAQATVEASSTSGGAGDAMILAPSTWLAVKLAGGATGSVPTGSCNFEVQVLP